VGSSRASLPGGMLTARAIQIHRAGAGDNVKLSYRFDSPPCAGRAVMPAGAAHIG
jgi:hypothetical protein